MNRATYLNTSPKWTSSSKRVDEFICISVNDFAIKNWVDYTPIGGSIWMLDDTNATFTISQKLKDLMWT